MTHTRLIESRTVEVKLPKYIPPTMRYTVPVGFDPKVVYVKNLDETHITYNSEMVIIKGKIIPTTFNCWNYWRYNSIE